MANSTSDTTTRFFCFSCGADLKPTDRFCPSCGSPVEAPQGSTRLGGELLRSILRRLLRADYEIRREVGEGGASIVYEADDLRRGCAVALKVLRPELAASLQSARFLREVRIMQSLQHPNIVPVFDSGQLDSTHTGGPLLIYFTLPFVRGRTLQELLEAQGPLPLDQALAITDSVGRALQYAHDRHVIHRDVKPSNVFLEASGQVLLTDFGIAKASSADDEAVNTATGQVVGTAGYMSPEQVIGEKVDGRSDQYSLACALYEMLAGHIPFQAGNLRAMMMRQLSEPTPPIQAARPRVPASVAEALHRALERQPADRFPSVAEFLEALRRAVPRQFRSIWGAADQDLKTDSCFVLMPFGDIPGVQECYRDHIAAVVRASGLQVFRADDIFGHREVIRDIWDAVVSARLIIADVTGRNPNVFYELGMAHTLGKDVIIVTQNGGDVPFDLTHLRYIQYEYSPRGMRKFEEVLRGTVDTILSAQ